MWLKYGWADGKPCSPHPMVVCTSLLIKAEYVDVHSPSRECSDAPSYQLITIHCTVVDFIYLECHLIATIILLLQNLAMYSSFRRLRDFATPEESVSTCLRLRLAFLRLLRDWQHLPGTLWQQSLEIREVPGLRTWDHSISLSLQHKNI